MQMICVHGWLNACQDCFKLISYVHSTQTSDKNIDTAKVAEKMPLNEKMPLKKP